MFPFVRRIYQCFCIFHWILILASLLISHGLRFRYKRSKPACFELTQNTEDEGYKWDEVPAQMKINLSCADEGLNKVIALESVTHSIPVNESNHCPTNKCPEDHHSCSPHSCCYAKDIMKCEEEITISDRQRNECNGKTECELLVNRQGLGSVCRRQIDYNCIDNTTKPEIRKCKTRWVTVGYNCIQESEYVSSTDMIASATGVSSLVIGLSVAVCVLLLLIVLVTVIFCLRHRQLKAKYAGGHHVVSSDKVDSEMDVHNDASVYYKAGPVDENALTVQPGTEDEQHMYNDVGLSSDTNRGLSTPLLQEAEKEKKRKPSYENIKVVSKAEGGYTKVDRNLKKKYRPKDIDASNTWHDPDKPNTPGVDADGIVIGAAGGAAAVEDTSEKLEMIENVHYEGNDTQGLVHTNTRLMDQKEGDYETV